MRGDDRVRFCGACDKNVYNLAGMTRREATALVAEREGSVCLRMFRRADGTVLTADCPVGIRAALRRARRETLLAAAAGVAAVTALIAFLGGGATKKTCTRLDNVRATLVEQAAEQVVEPAPLPTTATTPTPIPAPLVGAVPVVPPPPATPVMGDVRAPPRADDGGALMGKPARRPTMGEAVAPAPRMGGVARPR